MTTRTARAEWQGDLKAGAGEVELGSGRFKGPYTYVSRFESGEGGTNPEELIGAAQAGCFSMFLANVLAKAGHTPDSVRTEASVHLESGSITGIDLVTRARVPGIDADEFGTHAEAAKADCPVSKLLSPGTEITLDAALEG